MKELIRSVARREMTKETIRNVNANDRQINVGRDLAPGQWMMKGVRTRRTNRTETMINQAKTETAGIQTDDVTEVAHALVLEIVNMRTHIHGIATEIIED